MTIYELIEIKNNTILDTKLFDKHDRLINFLLSQYDEEQAHYLLTFGHISYENIQIHLLEKELF